MAKKTSAIDLGLGDFRKHLDAQNENPKLPVIQEIKPETKSGRPNTLDPTVDYVQMSLRIPKELKQQLKVALFTIFKDKHQTQEDLIQQAILDYLQKPSN